MLFKVSSLVFLAVTLATATPLEKRASCACGYVDSNGRVWVSFARTTPTNSQCSLGICICVEGGCGVRLHLVCRCPLGCQRQLGRPDLGFARRHGLSRSAERGRQCLSGSSIPSLCRSPRPSLLPCSTKVIACSCSYCDSSTDTLKRRPGSEDIRRQSLVLAFSTSADFWVSQYDGSGTTKIAEIDSKRGDILYGTFRMRAQIPSVPGVCFGGWSRMAQTISR